MTDTAIGSIDDLEVYLAQTVPANDRYRRSYVPVTPKSQEIAGAEAKIAPDSTIASWAISDWSAGEGDLRWRDVDRYNLSDTLAPATDGSGLVVGPVGNTTQYSSANFEKFRSFDVSASSSPSLYAAYGFDDNVYKWNASTEVWDLFYAVGGGATVASALAAGSSAVYVSDGTDLRKVTSAANTAHYSASSFQALGFFGSTLYGLTAEVKLYTISQTVVDTRTEVYDTGSAFSTSYNTPLAMSDVGPIFVTPDNLVHEYNQADATGTVVGRLPSGANRGKAFWARDTYFVPYSLPTRSGGIWSNAGTFIWYKSAAGEGIIGPIRDDTSTVTYPRILGLYGDRLILTSSSELWAYDMSDGAIVHLASVSTNSAAQTAPGIIHDAAAFISATVALPYICDRFVLHHSTTSVGTLDTGRFDFDYLGLNKILTKVTVNTEQPLDTGDSVNVAYSTDGDAFTPLTGSMVEGEASKTWTTSTSSQTIAGVDFEFRLSLTAGATDQRPKIVSLVSEAIGAESRVEWLLAIDVSTNNLQDGQVVLEGLKTLKATPAVVEFVDPWQQLEFESPEQFDVTVEDVSLPFEQPGGKRFAVVKLRAVETVGASVVTSSVVQPGVVSATSTVPGPESIVGGLAEPATVTATTTVPMPDVGQSGETDMPVSYVTADTTLSTQGIYIVDSSAENIEITLPAISTVGADGLEFVVIREGDNYVYLVCGGADEYWDGTTQKTLLDDYTVASAVAHDTDDEWHELGRFGQVT